MNYRIFRYVLMDNHYHILVQTMDKKLQEILLETGISDEDYELVKSGSRKRRLTQYKLEYARMALVLKYTHKEIAYNINITESSVKDMIYRNEGADK